MMMEVRYVVVNLVQRYVAINDLDVHSQWYHNKFTVVCAPVSRKKEFEEVGDQLNAAS